MGGLETYSGRMLGFAVAAALALFVWLAWRAVLAEVGRRAVGGQPGTIALRRIPEEGWGDPVSVEWLAAPLRELGYEDLGVYAIEPLAGFRLWVLLHRKDQVAAFLCERPQALGVSLELSVRYVDGTTTLLVNRPDNGFPKPPFFHVIHGEPDTRSSALHERLMRERDPFGIKEITPANVLPEYQAAWTRMMRWLKERGLTPGEVERIRLSGP